MYTNINQNIDNSNSQRVMIPKGMDLNNIKSRKAKTSKNDVKHYITSLKNIETNLKELAKGEIIYSAPIITRYDAPIIRKGTINIIQGKFGVHKSRFAELLCSLLLKNNGAATNFLGFKKNVSEAFTVCLVDTERNQREELPTAIQNIKIKAGYKKEEDVPGFRVTSLKKVDRSNRLPALKEWIEYVRTTTGQHLFILLDVVTDCVSSFNKDDEAMRLYDFLGNLCDESEVTFLLLIHENFGTEKARGHIGSEAANKGSTVMQIGFERKGDGEPTELIRLKFIKLRSAKKPEKIYLRYCDHEKGLILAESEFVQEVVGTKQKADIQSLLNVLPEHCLVDGLPQKELFKDLADTFGCSKNTIRDRLKTIEDERIPIFHREETYYLKVNRQKGKITTYILQPLKEKKASQNTTQTTDIIAENQKSLF